MDKYIRKEYKSITKNILRFLDGMSQYYKDIISKLICKFYLSPGKISTIFFSFWNLTDNSKVCIESKHLRIALQPLRKYGKWFFPSVVRIVILLQSLNRSIKQ